MNNVRKFILAGTSLSGVGILVSMGIVPESELEANKPKLHSTYNSGNLIFNWSTQQDVYYFVEGSPDLTAWINAKLLKDNADTGNLALATAVGPDKGFFRLSLEGDPDSARLRADDDGDKIINLLEVEAGMDAFEAEAYVDSDSDGLADYWEQFYFNTLANGGEYVAIEGGLSLSQAFAAATDPRSADSDGDGFSDTYETANGRDPNYNESRDNRVLDSDGDGLSDWLESRRGTDATVVNSDGDDKDDLEDAVGYNATFAFNAAPEGVYAVIDLGAAPTLNRIEVSDCGTVVFVDSDVFTVVPLGNAPREMPGRFLDLNTAGDYLWYEVGSLPKVHAADTSGAVVETVELSEFEDGFNLDEVLVFEEDGFAVQHSSEIVVDRATIDDQRQVSFRVQATYSYTRFSTYNYVDGEWELAHPQWWNNFYYEGVYLQDS